MLEIKWTHSAGEDMDGIADYLLEQCEDMATVERLVQAIMQAPKQLALFPEAGKSGRLAGTREWRVPRTHYALIYTQRDALYILRVMHDSRLFPDED